MSCGDSKKNNSDRPQEKKFMLFIKKCRIVIPVLHYDHLDASGNYP